MSPQRKAARRLAVTAPDGVRLAAWSSGDSSRPTVLLVHGYPDTHTVWDVVAAALAKDWHVLRYDARGSGESERPSAKAAYELPALAGDCRAVVGAAGVEGKVHVVGHDWGSITAWEAVTAADAAGWIASYTTISGPCLDHVAAWTRDRLRHPSPGRLAPVLRQQAKSWYLGLFQLPVLPELAWKRALGPRWDKRLQRTEGIPADEVHTAITLTQDALAGLNMYRANMFPRLSHRPQAKPAAAPVQFVVPLKDKYVSPGLAAAGLDWASPAWWRTIDTGHWGALITHGAQVASWVDEFARHIDGDPESAALAAARV
ncbi:alpha/beta fold hydrolase [Sporichthya sp.]|uniref:alpha/beta fold hydrolase n=1 Tax=Sporichthya sp. TaxID=65475 RepID=UPI0017BC4FE7|nr:alpha/beta fold hydrolase [Sporichthya sp.]MBA3745429.1 alpha/beta fold hydrolase [Sporichthya sp.]